MKAMRRTLLNGKALFKYAWVIAAVAIVGASLIMDPASESQATRLSEITVGSSLTMDELVNTVGAACSNGPYSDKRCNSLSSYCTTGICLNNRGNDYKYTSSASYYTCGSTPYWMQCSCSWGYGDTAAICWGENYASVNLSCTTFVGNFTTFGNQIVCCESCDPIGLRIGEGVEEFAVELR